MAPTLDSGSPESGRAAMLALALPTLAIYWGSTSSGQCQQCPLTTVSLSCSVILSIHHVQQIAHTFVSRSGTVCLLEKLLAAYFSETAMSCKETRNV